MKRICVVVLVCMMILVEGVFAQFTSVEITNKVTPLQLGIGVNQTTNLIFPYAIKSVDKGSKDVLVQKAKGVENVLQVKAGKQNFEVTNLTAITADGQLYSFQLYYAVHPADLNIKLGIQTVLSHPEVIFSSEDDNEARRNDASEQVALKKRTIKNISKTDYDISFRLLGLYIKDNVFYYQLELENNSNIQYDVDQLRFFIKDKKKSKRTASQELELKPQSITGNNKVIRRQSKQTVVVAIPKVTIPDKKYLSIQLIEANGGRHLMLRVNNKHLIAARLL